MTTMTKIKTTEHARHIEEMHGYDKEAFLRARGWKHTCEAPGSYWLWQRTWNDRVILVDRDTAMNMEAYFEADRCTCTEENTEPDSGSHATSCPLYFE